MDATYVMSFAMNALLVALILATPFLLVELVVGSLISLIQAATQVNEVTLTFVPKIIAVVLIIVILGSWLLQQMVAYTTNLFMSLPSLVQ